MSDTKPNPGSAEAIALGCECPVIDNGHGRGGGYTGEHGEPIFWQSALCPLHGEEKDDGDATKLRHYLRDARLTANGMRAAAEIARNFRPKSACTCGGYISFHYGIPCHQPGCLVGECLEIADEIDARADEIDETPDRWLAELDAAEGEGEGRE